MNRGMGFARCICKTNAKPAIKGDNKYFADIQIYPDEFSISFDLDEPDDDISYTLESKEQLYREISETIALLK